MKTIIGIIVLLLILGGGYLVLHNNKSTITPSSVTVTPSQSVPQTTTAAPSATISGQQVTVEGSEFAFMPATITAKVGKPVTITFKNTGKYPHNFTIADLYVKTETIEPGASTTVTFTPTKTGSFDYICTIPGHADKGMKGTLTVR